MDVKKYRDLSVTILCKSEGEHRLAKSEIALSENDCSGVSGVGDVRQVVQLQDGSRVVRPENCGGLIADRSLRLQ